MNQSPWVGCQYEYSVSNELLLTGACPPPVDQDVDSYKERSYGVEVRPVLGPNVTADGSHHVG